MSGKEICLPGYKTLPFSQVVRGGDFLFVSGQSAYDPDKKEMEARGVAAETDVILRRIADLLQRCGSSLADVVKVNAYLRDPAGFATFNAVYRGFFPSGPPARTTVAVGFVGDFMVEVDVIAYAPRERAAQA